jgi:RimJ/RimL family protein N-acetyltransferase
VSLGVSAELSRIKRFLWTSVYNYVYLRRADSLGKSAPSAPEFGFLRIRDEDQLSHNRDEFKLRYLITMGCSVYLAKWNGTIAGRYVLCNLSRFRPYSYNEHELFQENDSYYVFFCRTYESFRGNGIFPQILELICEDVWRENPCGVIYSSADVGNRPSQRGIEKAGFRLAGRLRYMAALNRPIVSRLETEPDTPI